VTVAGQVGPLLESFFGGEVPVRVHFWDGSELGAVGGPVALVKSRTVLRRLLWAEPELALAQSYVTGELDLEGDLREGLREIWRTAGERGTSTPKPTVKQVLKGAALAARYGAIGPRPKAPKTQARLGGRLHSPLRDKAAISHHYDLSNSFYSLILDPSMAYSSAYYTRKDMTLPEAQQEKLDLICRKLDMGPGTRHLDIGCGWGSLSLHAAEHFGAQVVGVTIAAEQKAFIDARIQERGLQGKVEIRLQDYREVPDGPFDSVTSIEMGEHVGAENYPVFVGQIQRLLRPGGRALIQQMSRTTRPGGGAFIESFIAPDMHMRPVGETIALLERGGLEVREVHAIREHYVTTVDAWYDTFEANWSKAVATVGQEMARVWRLYLVGGALTFEEGRMGVDQILVVKPGPNAASGMPLTSEWHTAGPS
jgi:cyclopropane-fatty-acyl-phospholipid synthase